MPFPLDPTTEQFIKNHFRRKGLRWEEDYFIEMLASEQKYDVYWATLALRGCGTEKCVPPLKEKLYHPMQDVKCTSILTVAHVAGAGETPFYARALLDPGYREKGYAMWAIWDCADERAVDAVLQYFTRNRGKLRAGKLANGTLVKGVEYLGRFRGREDVNEFLGFVKSIWPDLPAGERQELAKRVDYFGNEAAGKA
jgi:hypothetical protein